MVRLPKAQSGSADSRLGPARRITSGGTLRRTLLIAALAAASIALPACDDGPTAAPDASMVTFGFSTHTVGGAVSSPDGSLSLFSGAIAADVEVSGENGTLTITDVHFIVSEFKLEREEAACDELEGENDEACERFETGPALVDLPLDGGTVPVATQQVPSGSYVALKFEVADANAQAVEDPQDAAALLEAIEAAGYDDWPANASMAVSGSFTPAGGDPQEFTAYFNAEIKVVMDLDPVLVIDGDNGTVDVEVDPMAWFTNPDGSVIDLSEFDYEASGQVLDFESKMEYGFTKVELIGFDH